MIIELRRAEILAAARQRGGVELLELSRRFHVSIPTIRRDLSALAERGLVRRVHGGAVPLQALAPKRPLPDPAPSDVQAAACLVEPGMAIGISGRRLGAQLAALVATVPSVTIVTPVLAVARAVPAATATVLLIGGVRTPGGSHAGPLAEETLRGLHLDIAFVEPSTDPLAASTDRVMLARAARRVLL
jgi:DeoR/GlpR family transcriptional regulator of sugar metabolism